MKRALTLLTSFILAFTVATPIAQADELGLSGAGTGEDPYQIATAEDLDAFADSVNDASDDELGGATTSSHAKLVSDIDYNSQVFTGIETFSGVLDGDGNTISNIVYGPSSAAGTLGFVRNLTGGTITNLGFHGVTGTSENSQNVAGLVVKATKGATVTGNSLTNVTLTTGAPYAGGLAYEAVEGAEVSNNYIQGSITAARYAAGIAGYARYDVSLENNLVDTDIAVTGALVRSAFGLAFQGSSAEYVNKGVTEVYNNVILGGELTWNKNVATETQNANRVVSLPHSSGGLDTGLLVAGNLASDAVAIDGEVPNDSVLNGDTVAAAELTQETYLGLGWDFENQWTWSNELSRPIPAVFSAGVGEEPSEEPSEAPSEELTDEPTQEPTEEPTDEPTEEPVAPIAGLEGEGTEEAPFLIGSPSDLDTLAAALNEAATRAPGTFESSHVLLTADIDYAGETFVGIDTFTGVLDGDGHTISNISYGPSVSSKWLGLIRNLTGGTVTDLGLDAVTAISDDGQVVAGIAVKANGGATIEGNRVTNIELQTAQDYAGGLVYESADGVDILNNQVSGTMTSARYPSAITGYARYDVHVERNLIDATITSTGDRALGGLVLGYQGNSASGSTRGSTNLRSNALAGGSVAWDEEALTGAPGAHRVVGAPHSSGYLVLTNNLAADTVTVGGEVPASSPNEGDTTPASDFSEKETYVGIGWDFTADWAWDEEASRPVPAAFLPDGLDESGEEEKLTIDGLEGHGTEQEPFLVGTADELATYVTAVNESVESGTSHLESGHVQLTADIDFGGRTHPGITRLTGSFDGNGHRITNIVYGPGANSNELGFIRALDGGELRNLTIDGLVVEESGDFRVAGLVLVANNDAVIDGNALTNAQLTSGNQYVAGLAVTAEYGATITNNWVHGNFTSTRYGSATVGYGRHGVTVQNNLVDATVVATGNRAHAGLLLGYMGGTGGGEGGSVLTNNVVYGGLVDWLDGKDAVISSIVLGQYGNGGWQVENNLANESILVGGQKVEGTGENNANGTATSLADLQTQSTYENLGWDFAIAWAWNEELSHPVPARAVVPGDLAEHPGAGGEIEGLDGRGTEADPFLIGSAADLNLVATELNANPLGLNTSHFALSTNIDFAGGTFVGIDQFRGVLDGNGYKIYNLTYGPSETSDERALIRQLDGGTVKNLTIDGVVTHISQASQVSALVSTASNGAIIDGNTIINADLSTGAQYVAGLAANAQNGVQVTNNWAEGTFRSARYPAAVVGYGRYGTTIQNNLVDANVSSRGNRAHGGMILSYMGGFSQGQDMGIATNNVIKGGRLHWSGGAGGILAGRVLGQYANGGWLVASNLVSDQVQLGNSVPTEPGDANEQGTNRTVEELSTQQTYLDLGWDFEGAWVWDEGRGHPVPQRSFLFGSGTEAQPFTIDTPEDLEFLAEAINSGDESMLGGKHFAITADLDFEGREPFPGLDRFDGIVDGRNHTISNITLTANDSSNDRALIRELTGTVSNLAFDNVEVGSGEGSVAVLAVTAGDGADIRSIAIHNTTLVASEAEVAGGLVAHATGTAMIDQNLIDITIEGGNIVGGVVGTATDSATVSKNLVTATITRTVTGAGGAGLVAGDPQGSATITGNVVLGTSVDYEGENDEFAGRILGNTDGDSWIASSNLAFADTLILGETVIGPGYKNQHGADADAAMLADKSTYEELGWDFAEHWRWDAESGLPIVKYVLPEEMPNRITNTFYGDPETRRAFTWYQDSITDPASATVRISTDPEFTEETTIVAEHRTATHGETVYQTVATDLEPGVTYYYKVGDSAEEIWSETGTFVTADGESDFTFIDLTDTQAKGPAEADMSAHTMSQAIETLPEAEFMVHNGDVVQDSNPEQDWVDLLGAAQDSLLATTIAPASGNHDMHPQTFVDHFMLEHPNEQNTETGAYYSYTYNGAHFMVLNTNEDEEKSITDEQLAWLEQDAAQARENGAQWAILVMHKGLYTAGNHAEDPDIVEMRKELVPVIDRLDIDLVLQGHDHYYSRTKVLSYDENGTELVSPVETTRFTEVVNGKRYEYAVNPDGTIYYMPNTAGAKHYQQIGETEAFILEAFLDLFDRLGTPRQGKVQSFTGINVTDNRLTVEVYHISGSGTPVLAEAFGIDRQTEAVAALIDALPEAGDVTEEYAEQIEQARAAVDSLPRSALDILPNLDRLIAAERALAELQGLVSPEGDEVVWRDSAATSREAITVRNDSNKDFENAPVRLTIENTPDVGSDTVTIAGEDGKVLSHEVESWNPGSTSIIWVKIPVLAAHDITSLWAYFGGEGHGHDPADVWSQYALVDHLMEPVAEGETRTDSTGRNTGTVHGGDLEVTDSDQGTKQTRFNGAKIQYPGNIGGGYSQLAVSTVYSFTEEDLAAAGTTGGAVVGKQRPTDSADPAYAQVVAVDGSTHTRYNSNAHTVEVPADGKPHLVTQTYDGMTLAIFVDGVQQHEAMVERVPTNSDRTVQTTIGDLYTDDNSAYAPFHGHIDDVQIAGFPFIPEYEAFRYENYFGDAVTYGARQEKDALSLVIGSPANGTTHEAGLIPVSGTVSERSQLTAQIGEDTIFEGEVAAGQFTVDVPINPAGDQEITFTATSLDEARTGTDSISVTITDTTAPNQPIVSDDSATQSGPDAEVTLSATPDTDDLEKVTAQFFANETVELTDDNVTVREGATTDRTPENITPDSGAPAALNPTTVGENENPYQIYEIEVGQAAEYHLTWSGTGDDRMVSAWVYDHEATEWLLKDEGADADGGEVSLDITAHAFENAVRDGKITVLVWRGMTSLPWGEDHVYEQYPDGANFDWAFNHVPDTQLYAEATPWMMNDMFNYIVADADERKTELVIHAGDWVNREYLFDEYQWRTVDPSAQAMEQAGIPFMISWGNHDYSEDRNGRVMLPKYFPMERFEASTEGSQFEFGGSYDIDNFYYTSNIEGSKLLILSLGYWSSNTDDDPGITWAQEVIESHPDHQVILLSHDYLTARDDENPYSNPRINDLIVDKYPNVRLVLTGHNSGSYVSTREPDHGTRSYGILSDYQTRPWGGHEFYKNISVDAENGLLYVNTYSPWLDTWTSDGRWHSPISEDKVPGFHGDDSENFVLELDLGFNTTRTLSTSGLTLSEGEPVAIGEPVELIGAETGTEVLTELELDREYEWFVELTDQEGHVTRSVTSRFTIGDEVPVPSADQYQPAAEDLTITAGETGQTQVTFTPDLADDVTVSYEVASELPAGWDVTVTAAGLVTVAIPAGYEDATEYVGLTVTYGDGSTDELSFAVTVEAVDEPEEPEQPEEPEEPGVPAGDLKGSVFFLVNDWRSTSQDLAVSFGRYDDTVLVGDWDGDGKDSLAVRRGHTIYLSNKIRSGNSETSFKYGRDSDEVLVGDWDGDGKDTIAVRRGNTYLLKNTLAGGNADVSFNYGKATDEVLVGDWNGDNVDTITIRRGNEFHVNNALTGGNADLKYRYGKATDLAFAGDFDGDGIDTVSIRRGNRFHINNALTGGPAEWSIGYGRATDRVLVGDWDGDGIDTPGVNRQVK